MPDHDHIYSSEAERYELLISREDYERNIMKAMARILPDLEELDAVDIGAGTGRLACLLAPHVKSVVAADTSQAMLDVAAAKLKRMGAANWETRVADHRALPVADHSVDLVTAGWTICYLANTNVENWRTRLDTVIAEVRRILRLPGTAIIFENFGTGFEQPNPPDFLKSYYQTLESDYGFTHEYIRTDYRFDSIDEAERLTRFFFGDWLAERVIAGQQRIVPECTGIWWKKFR
ncbi:class I SAM-dependent methyltransferase [Paenibacillus tarimensis]